MNRLLWNCLAGIGIVCLVGSANADDFQLTLLPTGTKASFRAMDVVGPDEVWLAGSMGVVLHTKDAGENWRRVVVPNSKDADFRDLHVGADGSVLLMSVGPGAASKLYRSTDQGTSWKVVLANTEQDGFFDGLDLDGDNGILYGDPLEGRIDVYRTRDGGASWKRLPAASRPKVADGEYGFAASGSGVVVRGDQVWIATGGSASRVFRSSNLGETWTSHAAKIRSGNPSSGIFSIDFFDERLGVAIGGDYMRPTESVNNVALSSDGGKTWTLVDTPMPHKACVRRLSEKKVLACGRTGVAFSKDGGQRWTEISSSSYYVFDFDAASGRVFFAGSDGRAARMQVGATGN